MKHDTAIPLPLHTGFAADVRDALGAFWSSVFRDRELVDATVSARVLSACQAYIDVMEALSLRDHSGMPVFHREHWHPLLIRLSERNTGCGLVLGMESAKLGPQPAGSIYLEDSVFVIGGNAEFSKVNTYPLDPSARNLVSVGTCICDAIGAPLHVLFPGRDFMLRDGVLLVRKEQDPFAAGGYRIVEDGDDRIAVVWVCDAALDREHVGDFLAYPLGFDTPSTPVAARLLSALWDVVVYGLTPRHLNLLLGALFDVPTVPRDTVVESVTTSGATDTVVTGDGVYSLPSGTKVDCVSPGAALKAGTFLTGDLKVYHGISQPELEELVANGALSSVTFPPGSVAGVDVPVTISNRTSYLASASGLYQWFQLNANDSFNSPFWTAVKARTTPDERVALCNRLAVPQSNGRPAVNPLKQLGYVFLANTVLVYTAKPLVDDPCAACVLDMLRRLMAASGYMQIIQVEASSSSMAAFSAKAAGASPEPVDMDDTVTFSVCPVVQGESSMGEATDDVVVRFIPDTEWRYGL